MRSTLRTPTQELDAVWLSKVSQAARVTVDEEGCTAAAYIALAAAGAMAPPTEEVDFTLDRPFLFAVTANDGSVVFAGVVRNTDK